MSKNSVSRAHQASTFEPPLSIQSAARWWRIAVYVYLAALALTVVGAIVNWDAALAAAMNGKLGEAVTLEQARTSLIVSLVVAVIVQGGVAATCWWATKQLLAGNNAVRTALGLAAVIFVVNAAMNITSVVAALRSGADISTINLAVSVLIVAASVMALVSSVRTYLGAENTLYFMAEK